MEGGTSLCAELAFLLTIRERDLPMSSSTMSQSEILAANLQTLALGRLPRRKSRAHGSADSLPGHDSDRKARNAYEPRGIVDDPDLPQL
jgi:hypothetical protein